MILDKLSKLELEAIKTIAEKEKKMDTINSIKELLNKIDFSSEVVPVGNSERLKNLLSTLKGKELSESEIQLVKELE